MTRTSEFENIMGTGIDQQLIDSLKGFLDNDEGMGLYEFALKAGCLGPCLEIGSYCGKSTVYLAAGCQKNNSILFSIDHHRGSEEQQPGEEYFEGMAIPITFELPRASTVTVATRLESIPPESPISTFSKPFFPT